MKEKLAGLKSARPFFSFVGLLAIVLLAAMFIPEFRTLDNIVTIFRQASTLLILATGLTAVLLTGSMDLSVGMTAGFVGCTCAQLLKAGLPIPLVFLAGLLIGAAVGLINGILVSIVRLPGFIATYATNWVVGGLSTIVMQGAVIYDLPRGFTFFGVGYVGPIPVIVIIAAIVVVVAYLLLQKTTLGRRIYSYGASSNASLYSGVPITGVVILTFVFCSVCAGMGGLMMTARLNAAEAAMGNAYGLQIVAAVVIGGTSMLGGEGGVIGTVIGALLLTIIVNLMNLLGISSFAQPMVVGVVILAMVLFDAYSRGRAGKPRRQKLRLGGAAK